MAGTGLEARVTRVEEGFPTEGAAPRVREGRLAREPRAHGRDVSHRGRGVKAVAGQLGLRREQGACLLQPVGVPGPVVEAGEPDQRIRGCTGRCLGPGIEDERRLLGQWRLLRAIAP